MVLLGIWARSYLRNIKKFPLIASKYNYLFYARMMNKKNAVAL